MTVPKKLVFQKYPSKTSFYFIGFYVFFGHHHEQTPIDTNISKLDVEGKIKKKIL